MRLKLLVLAVVERRAVPMNYKNLNYEIETCVKVSIRGKLCHL